MPTEAATAIIPAILGAAGSFASASGAPTPPQPFIPRSAGKYYQPLAEALMGTGELGGKLGEAFHSARSYKDAPALIPGYSANLEYPQTEIAGMPTSVGLQESMIAPFGKKREYSFDYGDPYVNPGLADQGSEIGLNIPDWPKDGGAGNGGDGVNGDTDAGGGNGETVYRTTQGQTGQRLMFDSPEERETVQTSLARLIADLSLKHQFANQGTVT